MKNLKDKIIIFISAAALLLVGIIKADAQKVEFGFRYNPEFTGLMNKNDKNAGSELDLTNNFGYMLSLGGGAIYNFNKNTGLAVDILFSREGQTV